jgi:phytoene dehydrogenase-like protein
MLTKALAAMVEANGGEVRVSTPVKRLLLTDGTVRGVETEEGERITARVVVSATHIATTRRFVSDMDLPYQAKTLLDKTRIGNGFGMVVRCAVRELPRYTALPSDGEVGPQHRALQFICPSMDYLNRAYGDYLGGRPSQDPALIAMTFSAVDGSLAPAGNHTLFVWAQYYPYRLASGERWDDIGDREADRILEVLSRYAPNVQDAVIDRLVETPAYLERELGLYNGNVMHLEMSTDQMFMLRPALTLGKYKGLLPGLYLTGASTHPGGGIMGASGYNAAKVVLKEIGRRR